MLRSSAEKEKRAAAVASMTAAVLLTALKLGVGIATNSLGVLAEAIHSALDLMAAGMTYVAVRVASVPPDPSHPYGHGKIENLSALVETLFLLIACAWIMWEAASRLFFSHVAVMPSIWAVLAMVISIIVDYSRSRMLLRMAHKHRSQALEANALHFTSDMFSSVVVLAGLGALYMAAILPETSMLRPLCARADAVAALGVSLIVLRISWKLGRQAIDVLLDAGDIGLAAKIRETLRALPGIHAVRGIRPRRSGADMFVDLELCVDRGITLEEGEHIRAEVETRVRGVAEHATVTVVFAPSEAAGTDRIAHIRGIAAAYGLSAHAVNMLDLVGARGHKQVLVEMHVEFPPAMPLREAHVKVSACEHAVRTSCPDVIMVTHMEPQGEEGQEHVALPPDAARIKQSVVKAAMKEPGVREPHNVLARAFGKDRCVSFHCRMDPDTSVEDTHKAAVRMQKSLHTQLPELDRIIVHMEPFREEAERAAIDPQ